MNAVGVFNYMTTPSKSKYSLMIFFSCVGIAVLIYWCGIQLESFGSAALGILLVWALGASLKRMMYLNEDRRKVLTDNGEIAKIYPGYALRLEIGGKRQTFFYDIAYRHDPGRNIVINDCPSRKYTLPGRIENHFTTLLSAHGNSFIRNTPTVRLDSFEVAGDTLILNTSRSDFYSHLATNRAIDYQIDRKISIRELYVYGPHLCPLEESALSNHIGINALVFLNDGSLILKHRKRSSTISKNCLTSSVATRLIVDDYSERIAYSKETMDAPIVAVMKKRLKIDESRIARIDFLGFARDVYEGGKPQFYFDVRVDMSAAEYAEWYRGESDNGGSGRKSNGMAKDIDDDKGLYICSGVSIRDDESDRLTISYYDIDDPCRVRVKTLRPEKSLYMNLWFSEGSGLWAKHKENRPETDFRAVTF